MAMKHTIFALFAVSGAVSAVVTVFPVAGRSDGEAAPIYRIKPLEGYGDVAPDLSRLLGGGQ
jgi:hypothetical protein